MNDGWSGVEVVPQQPSAVDRFAALDRDARERMARFGEVHRRDAPSSPGLWVTRDGSGLGTPPMDRDAWPSLMEWMSDALAELRAIVEG
jgi:hypothetical protein